MSDLIVYGFPRSTFVNVVRLVLTQDAPIHVTRSMVWDMELKKRRRRKGATSS